MDPLAHFEFSQSSLQDFVDCRRRFQLRYIQRVVWPALQAEPARENERHMQRGERFHRLAQQYLLGVPEARLTRLAEADEDENLLRWWRNFLENIPPQLTGLRHVEAALAAPLDGFRLVAVYDLVLLRPDGEALIYDWKTSLHKPKRSTLLARLQTRVYPYVLAQAGASLMAGRENGHGPTRGINPDHIRMIYWFAEPDQPPEQLDYSAQRCQEDGELLLALVGQIRKLRAAEFEMAETDKPCAYCVYRSLCNRGTAAGAVSAEGYDPDEAGGPGDLDFNLEQIGEIGF